jgi:hypothetical protein
MRGFLFACSAIALSSSAYACEIDDRLVGYSIVAAKIIVARIDDGVLTDGFEGCIFGE